MHTTVFRKQWNFDSYYLLDVVNSNSSRRRAFTFARTANDAAKRRSAFSSRETELRARRPKKIAGKKFRPIRRRFLRRYRRRSRTRDAETRIGKNNLLTTFLWLRSSFTDLSRLRTVGAICRKRELTWLGWLTLWQDLTEENLSLWTEGVVGKWLTFLNYYLLFLM